MAFAGAVASGASLVDPHSVSLREPPLPRSTGVRKCAAATSAQNQFHFLSPGQGERWLAQRDGVGVFPFREWPQTGASTQ